jgi:RHS repeat-associated protein
VSGAASVTFVYDGDGNRVKATFGSATTVYVGNHYEMQGSIVRKYYYAGGARVAMREGSTLYYILTDHLGSTAITVNSDGTAEVGELRYYAYGKTRYTSGTTPTDRRFTGQIEDAYIKLYNMGVRWYDPEIGRWIQPDTIIPDPANPQSLNRYSYVYNRPLVYIDRGGHIPIIPLIGLVAAGVALLTLTSDVAPPPDSPVAHSRAGNQRVGEKALMVAAFSGFATLCAPATGGSAAGTATAAELLTAELADGDDDEAQITQKALGLLDELQTEGGRIPLDELDDRVMARLQQLGQAANSNEEFAAYVTQDNRMNLIQTSRYGGAPPADAVQWPLHTHFGTGVTPSGNDQVILSALGARSGQFHFSTIVDSQGNSAFFLPWPLEKWLETR